MLTPLFRLVRSRIRSLNRPSRFGGYLPLWYACVHEAEPQELPFPWPRHRTLLLIHLELEPEHSYGFRPGRSAHQAVMQAQQYIAAGYGWVVDLDLKKFFDRVNHDKLMAKIAQRVSDKRMLKLIRAFLTAGVMQRGLVSPVDEGTPQGGPLSPLLSNIVLDEFDRELERRGLRFARYADNSNIYVRSRRAGERVMKSVTRFITTKSGCQGDFHPRAIEHARHTKKEAERAIIAVRPREQKPA